MKFAVIPAYNEEPDIRKVISETKKYVSNIVVVDDGSRDDTYEEAKSQESKNSKEFLGHENPKDFHKSKISEGLGTKSQSKEDITVLKHIINLGKGATLKTGCDYAIEKGASQIIVLDADAQHEPAQIPHFLKELEDVDVVLGYRKLNKDMPFILKFGNWFINKTTKLLYGVTLHDTQCGYRAFTSDAYEKIRWRASNYSMESEMIANIGKKDLKYKEIPIKTIYADKYKGTTIIDGIKIILNLFWWRLSR